MGSEHGRMDAKAWVQLPERPARGGAGEGAVQQERPPSGVWGGGTPRPRFSP